MIRVFSPYSTGYSRKSRVVDPDDKNMKFHTYFADGSKVWIENSFGIWDRANQYGTKVCRKHRLINKYILED